MENLTILLSLHQIYISHTFFVVVKVPMVIQVITNPL